MQQEMSMTVAFDTPTQEAFNTPSRSRTALVLDSRGSDIPGHFRSKGDRRGPLCRAVRHVSSQLTKRSLEFGREKCRDPLVARKETRYTPDEHIYDWRERNGLTISSTQWASSEKDLLPDL